MIFTLVLILKIYILDIKVHSQLSQTLEGDIYLPLAHHQLKLEIFSCPKHKQILFAILGPLVLLQIDHHRVSLVLLKYTKVSCQWQLIWSDVLGLKKSSRKAETLPTACRGGILSDMCLETNLLVISTIVDLNCL